LIGPDGDPYVSLEKGALGGDRRSRVYGTLDCRSALGAIARDAYARDRVFFADVRSAEAAGDRPCGAGMRTAERRRPK
jgi:hypothetical protein